MSDNTLSHIGYRLHQNIKISAGIIGMAIVTPRSGFMPELLKAANEIPCVILNNIYADAATCCPRKPMYLPTMTEAEMAKAFPI